MIDALALAIALVSLVSGLTVAALALSGKHRWAQTVPTLVTVECALLLQAVLDVVALAGGHRPAEPSTHLAYLVTSPLVLPAAASQAHDHGRWSGLLIGGALVVVAVLVVRMQTTWRAT